jgi:flagella basal body P-ring formation protein FlgA
VARRANGVTEGACAADVPSTTFGGSAPPLRRGGEGRCIGQRLRGLIFALALVGAPAIAWAGQPVELKLHPVARGYITLGDLFENANETAAKVVVVHAPPAGLDAVLEATEIQMLARREGLDWSNQQGLLHITVASLPSGAPSSHSSSARTGERSARRARSGEGELTRTLVYARTVAGGDSLDNPALAIGKSARHPVHAGAPVQPYDLVSPKLIHAGDSVEVAYENDGIVLTLEGKAASDATLGDTVEVINTSSKKTIEAVASAPGRAVVGPAADVLKASMLSPTLHTAALN